MPISVDSLVQGAGGKSLPLGTFFGLLKDVKEELVDIYDPKSKQKTGEKEKNIILEFGNVQAKGVDATDTFRVYCRPLISPKSKLTKFFSTMANMERCPRELWADLKNVASELNFSIGEMFLITTAPNQNDASKTYIDSVVRPPEGITAAPQTFIPGTQG